MSKQTVNQEWVLSLILIQGIKDPFQVTIDSRINLENIGITININFNQCDNPTPGTPLVPQSFGPKLTTPIS